MKSLNIDSSRVIEIESMSLSCKYLEESKNSIYKNFDHDSYYYVMNNIDETDAKLRKIELSLKSGNYNAEHTVNALASIGTASAVIGLYLPAACVYMQSSLVQLP